MTAKTLRREVTLIDDRDKDHLEKVRRGEPGVQPLPVVTLHPGDELPGWVDESTIDDTWFNDPIDAAGSDLQDDNVYQVVKAAADEKGVEYGEGWSAEQIAWAVRNHDQAQAVVDELGETVVDPMSGDEVDVAEGYSDGASAMAALFDETNASGNANAPDQAVKSTRSRKPAGDGGAQSSST